MLRKHPGGAWLLRIHRPKVDQFQYYLIQRPEQKLSKAYLNTIRENSCYPTFRGFVTLGTVILFLIAALLVIAGFLSGGSGVGIVLGLIGGAVMALIAKVFQEVSLMMADIADSVVDFAGRGQAAPATQSPPKQAADTQPQTVGVDGQPVQKMGECPNCDSIIPTSVMTCPKCQAGFGPGSAWSVKPLA